MSVYRKCLQCRLLAKPPAFELAPPPNIQEFLKELNDVNIDELMRSVNCKSKTNATTTATTTTLSSSTTQFIKNIDIKTQQESITNFIIFVLFTILFSIVLVFTLLFLIKYFRTKWNRIKQQIDYLNQPKTTPTTTIDCPQLCQLTANSTTSTTSTTHSHTSSSNNSELNYDQHRNIIIEPPPSIIICNQQETQQDPQLYYQRVYAEINETHDNYRTFNPHQPPLLKPSTTTVPSISNDNYKQKLLIHSNNRVLLIENYCSNECNLIPTMTTATLEQRPKSTYLTYYN